MIMRFLVTFFLCLAPRVAFLDAPEVWQFGFQDPATPIAQGIQERAQEGRQGLKCAAGGGSWPPSGGRVPSASRLHPTRSPGAFAVLGLQPGHAPA